MTFIVGLGHYSRTGKDTTANALVSALRQRGVRAVKRSFASDLKAIAHQLFGQYGLETLDFYDQPQNEHLRDVPLPGLDKTPVEIWVQLGMDVRGIAPETWIDLVVRDDPEVDVVIVPDVRFPNEGHKIAGCGGYLVKVECPGVGPRDTPADQALVGWVGWDEVLSAEKGDTLPLVTWATCFAAKFRREPATPGTVAWSRSDPPPFRVIFDDPRTKAQA